MPDVLDISLGDMVVVFNDDDKPLNLTWNSRRYTVLPQGRAHIPFDCAKLFFGDPRSGESSVKMLDEYNQTQVIPDRMYEVFRLRCLWPPTITEFREFIPGDRTAFENGISDRLPHVRLETMTGEKIITVAEDPYGDTVVAAAPTRSDQDYLNTMIRQLAEQNAQMKAQLDSIERAGVVDMPPEPDDEISDGLLEAPMVATVRTNPKMAYNPRTKKITERKLPEADPTTIESLPTD
jgi:hypothetical protein